MKWDEEIDRLQREQVEAFIEKLNETRSMVGLLPLPAYLPSFHGCCCEPADDILNAIKPGPFEEYQKRLEEELDKFNKKHSKDLAEQTDNLKDELIDNYEERLKKLSETPFKLSDKIDDPCRNCQATATPIYCTTNITINVEKVDTLVANNIDYGEDETDGQDN